MFPSSRLINLILLANLLLCFELEQNDEVEGLDDGMLLERFSLRCWGRLREDSPSPRCALQLRKFCVS